MELLLEGSIDVSQDEDTLLKEFLVHGFTPISNDVISESKKRKRSTGTAISGYEHLLEATVKSMRQKPMQELRSLIISKKAEISKLEETSLRKCGVLTLEHSRKRGSARNYSIRPTDRLSTCSQVTNRTTTISQTWRDPVNDAVNYVHLLQLHLGVGKMLSLVLVEKAFLDGSNLRY
jgi:hypothetical protein